MGVAETQVADAQTCQKFWGVETCVRRHQISKLKSHIRKHYYGLMSHETPSKTVIMSGFRLHDMQSFYP